VNGGNGGKVGRGEGGDVTKKRRTAMRVWRTVGRGRVGRGRGRADKPKMEEEPGEQKEKVGKRR